MTQQQNDIRAAIREILLYEWDPLHLREIPEFLATNMDEYDEYVTALEKMVLKGESKDFLAARLHEFEFRILGKELVPSRTIHVAEKISTLRPTN